MGQVETYSQGAETGEMLENDPKDCSKLFDTPKEELYLLFYGEHQHENFEIDSRIKQCTRSRRLTKSDGCKDRKEDDYRCIYNLWG